MKPIRWFGLVKFYIMWVTSLLLSTYVSCSPRQEVSPATARRRRRGEIPRSLTRIALLSEMGWETARRSLPDLEAWAGTGQAEVAMKHALDLLDVLAAPGSVDLFYLPGSAFIAVLALWAARKNGSIPSPASLERMIRLGMHVHEDACAANAKAVLEFGVGFLESFKAWRFGTALALVLAKQLEKEEADDFVGIGSG
jgi:hypothetical protein